MERTGNTLLKLNERLSSGRRVNSAADDAAGLAISERLKGLTAALQQGQRNLNDGVSVARTAEGGLNTTSDLLIRQRELTVQAQNGTLNDDDRAVIQQEFDQLSAEITRISQSTGFNGRALLDGSSSGSGELVLEDGVEGGEDLALDIGDQSASSLGVEGISVSSSSSLAAIDQAINSVSRTRASIGSFSNRVEYSVRNLARTEESIIEANSRIVDTDFAEATADRTKNQILSQAQLGLRAHANVTQSATLKLLG